MALPLRCCDAFYAHSRNGWARVPPPRPACLGQRREYQNMYSIENGISLFAVGDISIVTALSPPTPSFLDLDYLARARLRVWKKSSLQG
jgi:hypothetical protein